MIPKKTCMQPLRPMKEQMTSFQTTTGHSTAFDDQKPSHKVNNEMHVIQRNTITNNIQLQKVITEDNNWFT